MTDELNFVKLAQDIAEWNEKTFPEAEESGQLFKLDEEFKEWRDGEQTLEEFADCFIVASALWQRWGNPLGLFVFNAIVNKIGNNADSLYNAVVDKMKTNKARSWKKQDNGSYHH